MDKKNLLTYALVCSLILIAAAGTEVMDIDDRLPPGLLGKIPRQDPAGQEK